MAIPPHSKPRHKKAPNKRSIIRWCVGTAMLTATALIISIPLIMRAEDNIQQAANVKAYAATITNTANKAIQESKRQAKLYNARLANQTSNQTDGEPATQNPDEYNRQLVIPPSDVMATINYPKLGISLPIRHGTSEQTLAIGAGHWEGTSLPIGEREPIPSSPHTGASPTNSCSPNSTKPEKVTNSPSPPSAKPSPIKCKQSAPSPPTISSG